MALILLGPRISAPSSAVFDLFSRLGYLSSQMVFQIAVEICPIETDYHYCSGWMELEEMIKTDDEPV